MMGIRCQGYPDCDHFPCAECIAEEMMDCYQRGTVPKRKAVDLDDPRARADFERMQREPLPRTVSFQYFRGALWPTHFVTNAALVMAALALIVAIAALIESTSHAIY
jgi:hypothetical protein